MFAKQILMTTTAAALLALGVSAHAENWTRLGVTNDGTIMEVDLDTVRKLPNGVVSISGAPMGRMYFDCKGHFGSNSRGLEHFAEGSFANDASDLACGKADFDSVKKSD